VRRMRIVVELDAEGRYKISGHEEAPILAAKIMSDISQGIIEGVASVQSDEAPPKIVRASMVPKPS